MRGFLTGGVPIAKVFGVEVRVHVSWVLILAIITLGVGGQFEVLHAAWPAEVLWLASGAIALLFFASVVVHELAHAFVARRRGLGGGVVTLLFFGGTTAVGREPRRPSDEAVIAAAGPLASLGIVAICIAVWQGLGRAAGTIGAAGSGGGSDAAEAISESALVLGVLNLLLAAINLLPVYPLDGGRLTRAALWRAYGDERRANRGVAIVGRWVGLLLVGGGFALALAGDFLDGLLLALSGWFLAGAGRALERHAALEAMLTGVSVESVMDRDLPSVAPQLTLDTFAAQYLADTDATSLPVIRDDSLLGLIGVSQLRRVPRKSWATTRAGDVMISPPALPTLAPEDDLWPALERLRRTGLDGLPVMRGQELLGILTRRSIVTAIQDRMRAAGSAT